MSRPRFGARLTEQEVRDPRLTRAARDLTALIGDTPLLRLNRVTRGLRPGVEVHVKAEWFNPGGSIKDRAAFSMVLDGLRRGLLTRDRILIDATSGNTGIGYAMVGSALGFRVRLCLPRNASVERVRTLRAYGADLVLTDPLEATDGAIREARRLVAAEPDLYFYPDQYNNDANWMAHYEGTGPEIWRQTAGRVTHFVAGMGTTGTFTGVGRRLRELNPGVRLVAVQPDTPFHGLDGMKHLATALVPGIHDPRLADENREIATEEAYAMISELAREEGLLVGPSGGAAVAAALKVAAELERGVVVAILPDNASRYMSERFWEELP